MSPIISVDVFRNGKSTVFISANNLLENVGSLIAHSHPKLRNRNTNNGVCGDTTLVKCVDEVGVEVYPFINTSECYCSTSPYLCRADDHLIRVKSFHYCFGKSTASDLRTLYGSVVTIVDSNVPSWVVDAVGGSFGVINGGTKLGSSDGAVANNTTTTSHDVTAAPFLRGVFTVPSGEGSKSREMKSMIEDWMFSLGCGRDTLMVAVGGGVVGDLCGFVASTFMRGIDIVHVATTLMAMVDSGVGGKTAINIPGVGKNLLGTFHQPLMTVMDMRCLTSLSRRIIREAVGEIIKYEYICHATKTLMHSARDGEEYHSRESESVCRIKKRDDLKVEECTVAFVIKRELDIVDTYISALIFTKSTYSNTNQMEGDDIPQEDKDCDNVGLSYSSNSYSHPLQAAGLFPLEFLIRLTSPKEEELNRNRSVDNYVDADHPRDREKGKISLISFSNLDLEKLASIVLTCVLCKRYFVAADVKESKGLREVLNFGHTIGHAIEALRNGTLLHGECIAAGMVAEIEVALMIFRNRMPERRVKPHCLISQTPFFSVSFEILWRLRTFLNRCGLPSSITSAVGCVSAGMSPVDTMIQYMSNDKKNKQGNIHIVLLGDVASSAVSNNIIKLVCEDSMNIKQLMWGSIVEIGQQGHLSPSHICPSSHYTSLSSSTFTSHSNIIHQHSMDGIPGSKSITNRALILAAQQRSCRTDVGKDKTQDNVSKSKKRPHGIFLNNALLSDDTLLLYSALCSMGIIECGFLSQDPIMKKIGHHIHRRSNIRKHYYNLSHFGSATDCSRNGEDDTVVFVGNSGSTSRFLLAFIAFWRQTDDETDIEENNRRDMKHDIKTRDNITNLDDAKYLPKRASHISRKSYVILEGTTRMHDRPIGDLVDALLRIQAHQKERNDVDGRNGEGEKFNGGIEYLGKVGCLPLRVEIGFALPCNRFDCNTDCSHLTPALYPIDQRTLKCPDYTIVVDDSKSSQFHSALLLSSPLLLSRCCALMSDKHQEHVEIVEKRGTSPLCTVSIQSLLSKPVVSKQYIEMTARMITAPMTNVELQEQSRFKDKNAEDRHEQHQPITLTTFGHLIGISVEAVKGKDVFRIEDSTDDPSLDAVKETGHSDSDRKERNSCGQIGHIIRPILTPSFPSDGYYMYTVEPDYSAACNFDILEAVLRVLVKSDNSIVPNTCEHSDVNMSTPLSLQTDSSFRNDVVNKMLVMRRAPTNAKGNNNEYTSQDTNSFHVAALQPININMSHLTDCFMAAGVLMALAGVHDGSSDMPSSEQAASEWSTITGISNQRIKECNRIEALCTELNKLPGVVAVEIEDGLKIKGNPSLLWRDSNAHTSPIADENPEYQQNSQKMDSESSQGHLEIFINTYKDHRMAMAFGTLGVALYVAAKCRSAQSPKYHPISPSCDIDLVIEDWRCVEKTFPLFFSELRNRIH